VQRDVRHASRWQDRKRYIYSARDAFGVVILVALADEVVILSHRVLYVRFGQSVSQRIVLFVSRWKGFRE